nr:hypothetical protein [Mesomycoplasma hyorhinis]
MYSTCSFSKSSNNLGSKSSTSVFSNSQSSQWISSSSCTVGTLHSSHSWVCTKQALHCLHSSHFLHSSQVGCCSCVHPQTFVSACVLQSKHAWVSSTHSQCSSEQSQDSWTHPQVSSSHSQGSFS